MISPAFCATMARYNRWQNGNLLAAADTLDDAQRRADRGAFFGSIHGTFSHLIWADKIWMSRLAGWDKPDVGIPGSAGFVPDWTVLRERRADMDRRMILWADTLEDDALDGDLAWFSGALGRDAIRSKAMCVAHMFNHQTHHRGQIHAMLTAAGARPDDTDLFAMPPDLP